jgi:hypothetical protein
MNTLNSKFWETSDGVKFVLNSKVRKNLIKIAKDFLESLDVKSLKLIDIRFTGSLANYNWHDKSDIDLHLIFDLSNFERHAEFIKKLLIAKKTIWNDSHDINMFGHVIELYPENKTDKHVSTGVYSLIKDEWIEVPVKKEFNFEKPEILEKYQSKVNYILYVIDQYENKKKTGQETIDCLRNFLEILKESRKEALSTYGEFSTENIIFKMLRKNGHLQRIVDTEKKIYDDELSLEQSLKLKNIIKQ